MSRPTRSNLQKWCRHGCGLDPTGEKPQWCQVKQWDDLQRKKHTKSWSFQWVVPSFVGRLPWVWTVEPEAGCVAWRCYERAEVFSLSPKVEGMTSDRHSRIKKNVQFAQQCFGAVWGHQNPWAPKIPGSFFLHRFQQPQVRVPAPTANRPRCRWDRIFFFCWKIGIRKFGKRKSPSKPIFLVSILGFLCFFWLKTGIRGSQQEEKQEV